MKKATLLSESSPIIEIIRFAISTISFSFFDGAKIQKISDMCNTPLIELTFFM